MNESGSYIAILIKFYTFFCVCIHSTTTRENLFSLMNNLNFVTKCSVIYCWREREREGSFVCSLHFKCDFQPFFIINIFFFVLKFYSNKLKSTFECTQKTPNPTWRARHGFCPNWIFMNLINFFSSIKTLYLILFYSRHTDQYSEWKRD